MLVESITLFQLLKPKDPELPQPKPKETVKVAPKPKPKKQLYVIKSGDSLSKIGKATNTPWKNIWAANPTLKHQDKLEPGIKLIIPKGKVKPRKLANVSAAIPKPKRVTQSRVSDTPRRSYGGANTYEPGQCVWFIKNLRPEIPNTWGNASDWLANAKADGWPTGGKPRVGAVGWTPGHVVLITHVEGSYVRYKDMNGRYIPFEIGYGRKPAYVYSYIY